MGFDEDAVVRFVGGPEDGRNLVGRAALRLVRRDGLAGAPNPRTVCPGHRVVVFPDRDGGEPIAMARGEVARVLARYGIEGRILDGPTYVLGRVEGATFIYRHVAPRRAGGGRGN